MNAAAWTRAKSLLADAATLPATDRERFVVDHCEDLELRREVLELLASPAPISEILAAGSLEPGAWLRPYVLAPSADGTTRNLIEPPLFGAAAINEGRFPAGTVLADRYRIIGLLGRGGMGEVYRADDLKLGQPVALKFLLEHVATDSDRLARFHAEVRLARQVSHPNICRVYDIGEVDGSTFLSMEYVDGEDLRSLLRRIGRLPGDKALEIARGLCAGLAAAHDKHVLHRDLKPANILIDGRGQVLITDFGVAGLIGEADHTRVREGTPAYMAPEQLAGKSASVRSDIYSLGLVLHEMFTGKPVFEPGIRRITPTRITSSDGSGTRDLDPRVGHAILRCLQEDPRHRPASVLAVAGMLPGGDALAAALAAGETPSPRVVAAAGLIGGMSVRSACMFLAAILVGLIAAAVLAGQASVLQKTPFENAPEVLAKRARELIQTAGYIEPPIDRAYGFGYGTGFQQYAEKQETRTTYRAQVANGQPPLIFFWYRQSPEYLLAFDADGLVTQGDPPPVVSGMIRVMLDPQGRLIVFSAVPPQGEEAAGSSHPIDWSTWLGAAGVDMARFTAAEPRWLPLGAFDTRVAWTGSYAHAPEVPMRIEAASWHGKPVSFQVIGPWLNTAPTRPVGATLGQRVQPWLSVGYWLTLLIVPAVLGWRNVRAGRSDLTGASKLAAFAFGCQMLIWLCTAHHVPTPREYDNLLGAMSSACSRAGYFWVLYVGLEPHVRRRWPESLITWSRVLEWDIRSPLVGEHLLIGVTCAVAIALLFTIRSLVLERLGSINAGIMSIDLDSLLDARHVAGAFASVLSGSIGNGMTTFFVVFLLRALLRRQSLALAAFVLLGSASFALQQSHPVVVAAVDSIVGGLVIFNLIRFGVLPMIVIILVASTLARFPLTHDFSRWYAGSAMFPLLIVFSLAVYAFNVAVAGRPLLKDRFLED